MVPLNNSTDDRIARSLVLNFNFCGPAIKQCTLESGLKTSTQVIMLGPEVTLPAIQACSPLAPSYSESAFKTNETLVRREESSKGGIRILFNNTSSSLPKGDFYFNFQVSVLCEKSISSKDTKFYLKSTLRSTVDPRLTTIAIEGYSTNGCAVYSSNFIIDLLEKYKYIYVVLAFVIGLILCFLGRKIIKFVLFLVRCY